MSKLIATTFATCTLLTFAGTAHANDDTFSTSFAYDRQAPVEQTYSDFQKSADAACKQQIQRAGFRQTESTSWELRKCKSDLIAKAVKATRNKTLIAFHKSSLNPGAKPVKLASAK